MIYIASATINGNAISVQFSNNQVSNGTILRTYNGAVLTYFPESHMLVHLNLRYRDYEIIAKGVTIE